MLIAGAELHGHGPSRVDLRIRDGHIEHIGQLAPEPDEPVVDALGGALLPGLHDHHLHLLSYAASLRSVRCGPPDVSTAAELAAQLRSHGPASDGWIRGIGYHESVAGDIDRHWLDRHVADVPVRIQHRSGRLWIVNSAGLDRLNAARGRELGRDGRLYDRDAELRALIGTTLPPVDDASRQLARWGVTGVTDMTPHNSADTLAVFRDLQAHRLLLQRARLAGTLDLGAAEAGEPTVGETKIHLHESALPDFDVLRDTIRRSHELERAVAIHCVTEVELVFALATLRDAPAWNGDRIEHASVTPPALLEQLRELGLTVVTQPNFVAERGDAYLTDVPAAEHAWLYRCRSFLDAGIPLAGGTDAPFGDADPWRAMHAAVSRLTARAALLNADERVSPEEALALFLGSPATPAEPRVLEPGAPADFCLLDVPWRVARESLSSEHVRMTFVAGDAVWERSQPGEDGPRPVDSAGGRTTSR